MHPESRTGRAVLGDKTTNAKAKNTQTINGKNATAAHEVERTQARPSRPRTLAPKAESSKLQILLDSSDPLSEVPDTTNAHPPAALPYVSDVFPNGVLKFDSIRPENWMKGYHDYYHNRRDDNGMTRLDREVKAAQEKRFREADARIMKDLEEMEWNLGFDSPQKKAAPVAVLPESADKQNVRAGAKTASTLNSRRAASALSMAPSKLSSSAVQRKPLASKQITPIPSGPSQLPSFMQPTRAKQSSTTLASRPRAIPPVSTTNTGVAASRSTLGYNKGRSASSVMQHARSKSDAPARRLARSGTAASANSDATITPSSYAKDSPGPKPEFVSIFDAPPEEDDGVPVVRKHAFDDSVELFGCSEHAGPVGDDKPVALLAAEAAVDDFELDVNL